MEECSSAMPPRKASPGSSLTGSSTRMIGRSGSSCAKWNRVLPTDKCNIQRTFLVRCSELASRRISKLQISLVLVARPNAGRYRVLPSALDDMATRLTLVRDGCHPRWS
jgi:hypothetical protein